MCGIIGIVGQGEVAAALYDALTVLQHRGQDAAGIATIDGKTLRLHKANGLVRDVFDAPAMTRLTGLGVVELRMLSSNAGDRELAHGVAHVCGHRNARLRPSSPQCVDQHGISIW